MFQLYFLTVLTNIFAGLALSLNYVLKRYESFSRYTDFMSNPVYRVILAIVTFLVGVINLFPSYEQDIPILGELLPSLSGMITGFLLISEFINSRKKKDNKDNKAAEAVGDIAEKVEKVSAPYLTIVGITAVIIGVLHAFLPKLTLL